MVYIGYDDDELWKPIYYKNEITNYEISTYGRVRNKRTGKYIKQHIQNNEYYGFTLSIKGKPHSFKTARVVAKTFIYNDDPITKTQVNHIIGEHKWNNSIYNLEWVTPSENQDHAIKTGLRRKSVKYDIDKVLYACKLLEDDVAISEISKLTGMSTKSIYDIVIGSTHKNITKNFDFSKRTKNKTGPKNKYNDDCIHTMCKMWCDGKLIKEISDVMDIPENTIYGIISGRKKQYNCITSQYDLKRKYKRKNDKYRQYSNEQIHTVCKLLTDNIPVYKIEKMTGMNSSNIYKIKNKKIYQEITKTYNF